MSFDLTAHMNAISRTVRNFERDGKPATAVVASCVYDTDPADLWDALTNQERLPRWFAPIHGELKLGGRFQVEGNASGTVTKCEPARRIEATWEFGGGVTWVNITLTPDGDGTRLELEHIANPDPHWANFGPAGVGVGWDLSFMGLSRHLAEPEAAVAQEAVEGWFASEEAKTFIRSTSSSWGAADADAGAPREDALAKAENTRKFYTGEAPPPEM